MLGWHYPLPTNVNEPHNALQLKNEHLGWNRQQPLENASSKVVEGARAIAQILVFEKAFCLQLMRLIATFTSCELSLLMDLLLTLDIVWKEFHPLALYVLRTGNVLIILDVNNIIEISFWTG